MWFCWVGYTSFQSSCVYCSFYHRAELKTCISSLIRYQEYEASSWEEVFSPSPPPPTKHLYYINILSLVLEFDVKELQREIDRQKQERKKKDRSFFNNGVSKKDKHFTLFGWLEHRMLWIPSTSKFTNWDETEKKMKTTPALKFNGVLEVYNEWKKKWQHWNLMVTYKYNMNWSWNYVSTAGQKQQKFNLMHNPESYIYSVH